MNRRAYLQAIGGTVTAAWSAGCLFGMGGGNGLELERVDSLAGFAAIQSTEFTATQTALVEETLANGEAATYGHRPFSDGEYLEFQGTFYRATVEQTGTKQMGRLILIADEREEAGETISVADVPAHDREPVVLAIRFALVHDRENGREDLPEGYVFRGEEQSIWIPEPEHEVIEHGDRTFHLRVEKRELEEDEYTTTLEPVASSPDEFENRIEAEFVIDLDAHELSDEQRDIIETAIEGEYRESGSISPEFSTLITLLRDNEPRHESVIKYEGEYYAWTYWHSD